MTQKNTEDVFESACRCGKTAIASAARTLVDGGIVAFPAETVCGLGANDFDARAATRVFDVKNRPTIAPLIVHMATLDHVMICTAELPDMVARRLAEACRPGPLTLVLRKPQNIPFAPGRFPSHQPRPIKNRMTIRTPIHIL
ncbi:MAG: L-threonylcarbamoyladenylate synthase [Verrucomicrobiota bacterium]